MESAPATAATLQVEETGGNCRLTLGGQWDIQAPRTVWNPPADARYAQVVITTRDLQRWDGSLVLFLGEVRRTCEKNGWTLASGELPAGLPGALLQPTPTAPKRPALPVRWLIWLGLGAQAVGADLSDFSRFIGNCTLSLVHGLRRPRRFRWRDCFEQIQLCGAQGLPIVGLISFLVGVTMAYQAALQLRQFGADVFVADLIGLGVVREMGPMMAAVIVAGRTGAAFAAQLANMKANEEIDALVTFGLNPVSFLVLPRLLALLLMMPLLALYANALGILGGMLIAGLLLDIPPVSYWIETTNIIALSDLASGLIKAGVFGLLIGIAGCLRGLQADRSAAGVGLAATSAVVTGILFVILADALFAVIFHVIGL